MNLPLSRGISDLLRFARGRQELALSLTSSASAGQTPLIGLPMALAFLNDYGVSADELTRAALQARNQGVFPEAALLASGAVQEGLYYRCLAHRLNAKFTCGRPALAETARYPYAVHAGLLPLKGGGGPRWLVAPRGRLLHELLARGDDGQLGEQLAITTPSHLSRLARSSAALSILHDASLGLASLDPGLSAKTPPSILQQGCTVGTVGGAAFALGIATGPLLTFVSLSMTCLFLTSIWLRLFAGAASSVCCKASFQAIIEDRWLPSYSIVVALHREARVLRQLVGALDALDYPILCSKLTY